MPNVSATGAIEGQFFIKTRQLVKLSEQNLIDCNRNQSIGNWGCTGGNMRTAYEFLMNNGGINPSSRYPYKGRDSYSCEYSSLLSVPGLSLSGYQELPSGNETLMKLALSAVGPLSVAIDASLATFHSYNSGIYSDSQCSTTNINHAMLLVGYGTDNTTEPAIDFWIIKNSCK